MIQFDKITPAIFLKSCTNIFKDDDTSINFSDTVTLLTFCTVIAPMSSITAKIAHAIKLITGTRFTVSWTCYTQIHHNFNEVLVSQTFAILKNEN